MAYQVLASWFISSPLTFRPQLFSHISKYLYYFIKEKNDLLAEANIDLVKFNVRIFLRIPSFVDIRIQIRILV
jgi:hypothetical protein